MKKLILLVTLVSSSVFANNQTMNSQQGFSGPAHGLNTVEEVLDSGMFSDDTAVTLTGHLVASLGGDIYTFKDNTGTISVEIDSDDYHKWFGSQVIPKTKIIIFGDTDTEFDNIMVDVDRVSFAL